MESLNFPEQPLESFIMAVRLGTDWFAALWIAVGFIYAVVELVGAHLRHRTESFTSIRLTFSRYLSLALEFQLAGDILSTAISPTWKDLGMLGVIAAIRTALNYFLAREIREYRERDGVQESFVQRPETAPVRA